MIRVSVKSYPRGEIDKSLELPDESNALDLLRECDLRPDSWILVRDEKVIPDDAPLRDGDSIRLLSVISGGSVLRPESQLHY